MNEKRNTWMGQRFDVSHSPSLTVQKIQVVWKKYMCDSHLYCLHLHGHDAWKSSKHILPNGGAKWWCTLVQSNKNHLQEIQDCWRRSVLFHKKFMSKKNNIKVDTNLVPHINSTCLVTVLSTDPLDWPEIHLNRWEVENPTTFLQQYKEDPFFKWKVEWNLIPFKTYQPKKLGITFPGRPQSWVFRKKHISKKSTRWDLGLVIDVLITPLNGLLNG